MEKNKIIRESLENVLDKETGEVVVQRKFTESYVEKEPDYVKLYFKDLAKLNDLSKGDSSFMLSLLKRVGYNNQIILVSYVKKQICEELGLKMKTIDKAISVLVKKQILIREDRGLFIFNPYLFGRGKWKDIKKIRLEISYSLKGREVLTVMDTQTDLFDAIEETENKAI